MRPARQSARRRLFRRIRPLSAVLVLAGALTWTACSGPAPQAGKDSTESGSEPLPTVRATRRDFALTAPWLGTVESRQSVTVVALQAGRIVSVEVADGARVDRGAPLFRLAGPAAERRRATLETKVASLEERARAAEQTAALRRQALAEQLVRRDELLAAEGDLAAVRADLAAARQELDALGSALALRAPIGGTFTGRRVAVGQDVTAGEALGRIVDARRLRVVAALYLPASAGEPADLEGAPVTFDGGRGAEGGGGAARIARVLPERGAGGAVTVWIEGGPLDVERTAKPPEGEPCLPGGPGRRSAARSASPSTPAPWPCRRRRWSRDEQDRPFVFVPRRGPGSGEGGYERRPSPPGSRRAAGWR